MQKAGASGMNGKNEKLENKLICDRNVKCKGIISTTKSTS